MRNYITDNINSRRRQWTAFDTTIKSIRVQSDPSISPVMWEVDDYYEFSIDIKSDGTTLSLEHFPSYVAPTNRVNEEGYTNPNSNLPVMNERYILEPKYHSLPIIVEFFGDYSSVVIYGLPDEAYVVVDWKEVTNECDSDTE